MWTPRGGDRAAHTSFLTWRRGPRMPALRLADGTYYVMGRDVAGSAITLFGAAGRHARCLPLLDAVFDGHSCPVAGFAG